MTVGYSIVGEEVSLNKTWKKEGSDVGETERKIFELVVGRDNEMAFKVKANADTRERKREIDSGCWIDRCADKVETHDSKISQSNQSSTTLLFTPFEPR